MLAKMIQKVLSKATKQNDSKEIYFHWNADEKTWCLSGTTIGGLVFETEDYEASNRAEAEQDAVAYLEYYV